MNRFVILRVAQGSFETGFTVICQIGIGLQQPHIEQVGCLPPAPELPALYQAWRSQYLRLGNLVRLEPQPDQATNLSFLEDCIAAAQALEQAFNQWLSSIEFRTVREKLLEQLRPEDSIRMLVVTEQGLIQKLPWHLWDLLERYPLAEIGFSLPMSEVIPAQVPITQGVNILAVLGDKTGLDTKADQQLLTGLPQATVKVLVEPSRNEFNAHLWDQAWDILFFAGHSTTDANGEGGLLWLNAASALTISDLKYALRKALGAGLQLAIFNSCDGLGLAKALADLRMPHMIVMREPVPDVVARAFLEFFLGAFSQGQSFHLAVREARERLQGLESEFPCATWLPAIVQSPMAIPPSWDSLGGFSQTIHSEHCPTSSTLVTMVWTDLLESTRIKQHLQGQHTADRNQYYLEQVLQPHRQRVEHTARQYGGTVVKTEGDACFLVFNTVAAALNWAIELQRNHTLAPIATPLGNLQVRVGIHTGSPLYSNGDYIGQEVDYLVRLADLAQGSQILVSEATAVLTRNLGFQDLSLHAHGNYLLKGIGNVPVFEILWEHKPPQSPRVDVKALYDQGYLQAVKSEIATASPQGTSLATPAKKQTKQTALKTLAILLAGLCSTAVVLGARAVGGLQSIELWSFDQLMRLRPLEKPDERLLLITVTAEDLLQQPADNRRSSLSDRDLLKLLQKIVRLQPSVVGLDIYRDFPVEPQYPELAQQLRQNSKLITVCKSRDATGDPVGVAPPKESPVEQLGFSDFIEDNDGILRRQILFMTPDPLSPCPAYYGFGAQVALRYLAGKGIHPEFTANGDLKLKSTVFRRMQAFMGAYQSSTEGGHQMMLNFRALPNPQDIATQVSVSDVLNDRVSVDLVKNRAILIGVNANSSSDFWGTPYGAGGLHKTSGIFIQAHMVSQILSAVLDRRPTISPGNFWTDGLWLWGFGALGGMIVQVFHSVRYIIQSSVLACGLLISIGLAALVQGIWIPVVPAILTFGATTAIVGYQKLRNTQELLHLPQQTK